jgi:tRNA-splicing ligase RtcB
VSVTVITKDPAPSDGFDPRVFASGSAPPDPDALASLTEGVQGADLAAPPVVLPDFHHKQTMEMPSSIAIATVGTIRPTYTSSSVNCGMALIALEMAPPTREAVGSFYREVRERYPHPPTRRRELARSEVLRAAVDGAVFAAERFGVDDHELDRIEERGRLDAGRYGGPEAIRRLVPESVIQLSRLRFGTIGPSNHFLELQRVEEVFDPAAAERLGVREGQLTLQYHGGGGALAGQLGRMFGRRKKLSSRQRAQMAVLKPLFHLASASSIEQIRRRVALYFNGGCPPVPLDGAEGARLMLANAAAMNYGFAFRLAIYSFLRSTASRCFGATDSHLVVDSPHNSIYEEGFAGTTALVHRHNASRAFPASMMPPGTAFGDVGQAVLVPGTHRTSSYLCVAGERADRSLYSACHGAGTMVADFERRSLSTTHPEGHRTLRFGYSDGAPEDVPQLDDRGVNEAMSILVGNGLVRKVARMRPIAVLH